MEDLRLWIALRGTVKFSIYYSTLYRSSLPKLAILARDDFRVFKGGPQSQIQRFKVSKGVEESQQLHCLMIKDSFFFFFQSHYA